MNLFAANEPKHPAGTARKSPDHHGPQQAPRYAAAQVSLLFSCLSFLCQPPFFKRKPVCQDEEGKGILVTEKLLSC